MRGVGSPAVLRTRLHEARDGFELILLHHAAPGALGDGTQDRLERGWRLGAVRTSIRELMCGGTGIWRNGS